MKKLVVLITGVLLNIISYAQISDREFNGLMENVNAGLRDMDYRRGIGGHRSDSNFVFQSTLLKLFRGTLNIDSLIASQPQLSLITVNEFITSPVYTQNSIEFFNNSTITKYHYFVENTFSYKISEIDSKIVESITIRDRSGNVVRYIVFYYEIFSNQIRTIVDNVY